MLISYFAAVLILSTVYASYPLYIDELEPLVNLSDRRQLDILDDDDYTPRSELQSKFQTILNRQNATVQSQYNAIVQLKEQQRNRMNSMRMQDETQNGDLNVINQINDVMADLSLSEREAEEKVRTLKRQLNGRRMDSDSNEIYG